MARKIAIRVPSWPATKKKPPTVSVSFNPVSAINNGVAGATITIPTGVWQFAETLRPKAGMTIQGTGTLKLMGGTDYTLAMHAKGAQNLKLIGFTIDANAASATKTGTGEQRHCILLESCPSFLLERVTGTQPMGDFVLLWRGSSGTVKDCIGIPGNTPNARVGINTQGANDTLVTGCDMRGFSNDYKSETDAGQDDTCNVRFVGNKGNNITLSGTGTARHKNYLIEGNDLSGQIYVARTDDLVVRRNVVRDDYIRVYSHFDNQRALFEENQFPGDCYCDYYLTEYGGYGPSNGIRITREKFGAGSRQVGCVRHVSATVTGVEVDHCQYPAGETLWNPYGGPTANVHDNEAV